MLSRHIHIRFRGVEQQHREHKHDIDTIDVAHDWSVRTVLVESSKPDQETVCAAFQAY